MKRRIAVIGGGWGGCAATVALARDGHPVTLFESSRTLGGRARRVDSPHGPLDNGQHILSGAYRETLALMRLVGADPEHLLLRLPLSLVYPGQMEIRAPRLPAPLHLATSLLAAKGLSLAERLAALRLMLALKLRGFKLDEDESVAELLTRLRQPERLRQLLWQALSLAALNTPAERASAQVFAHVLRDSLGGSREASDLLLPKTDLSALFPEPAATYLQRHGGELRLSCPVRRVAPLADGAFRLVGDGWNEEFSAVILAVAPYHALALLPDLPQTRACRAAIQGLSFEPILTATLAYGVPVPLPCPMVGLINGLTNGLTNGPGQWLFDRSSLLGQGGGTILTAVISGPHPDMTKTELTEALHAQVCALAGPLSAPLPAPLWCQIITEKRATFSCRPGLSRPAMDTGLPGLLLCGDYVASDYPATLETAVRSGLACAARLAPPLKLA